MKVLGIGLGRTGTTSLARALQILGYKTKHCPDFYLGEGGELIISSEDVREYEALTDEPTILVFKDVDREYPGSKFILTTREMDGWLTSIVNNGNALREFRRQSPAIPVLFEVLYGSSTFDRDIYAEAHHRHVVAVRDYFSDRPQDLLVMDICAGDGWEKMCPFLSKPIPDRPFPERNVFGVSDAATLMKKGIVPGSQRLRTTPRERGSSWGLALVGVRTPPNKPLQRPCTHSADMDRGRMR